MQLPLTDTLSLCDTYTRPFSVGNLSVPLWQAGHKPQSQSPTACVAGYRREGKAIILSLYPLALTPRGTSHF